MKNYLKFMLLSLVIMFASPGYTNGPSENQIPVDDVGSVMFLTTDVDFSTPIIFEAPVVSNSDYKWESAGLVYLSASATNLYLSNEITRSTNQEITNKTGTAYKQRERNGFTRNRILRNYNTYNYNTPDNSIGDIVKTDFNYRC